MAAHQVADVLQLLPRVDIARGVVRVAEQDGLRARRDGLFKRFDGGQCKAVIDGREHRLDHRTARHGHRHIVGISRLRDQDFVTRVEAGQKDQRKGFGGAGGDENLVRRDLDRKPSVVLRHLLAQAGQPVARTVTKHLLVDPPQRLEAYLGRRDVGLADI